MNWKKEWKPMAALLGGFLVCFHLPVEAFDSGWGPLFEALHLVRDYARKHVLACLVPAFFIAGAVEVFISRDAVMRYLGPDAPRLRAYGVASISGGILAVCSCTVLPLFAGIYCMGAGLGPAVAFLYSGPAINVLAIVLTTRVLGVEMGVARAVGAVVFSVVIGWLMHRIFRKEELKKSAAQAVWSEAEHARPLGRTALYFAMMVGVLVFANWGRPTETVGLWHTVYALKWPLTSGFAAALAVILVVWFDLAWWRVALAALPVAALAWALPGNPLPAFVAGTLGLSVATATSAGEPGEWFAASWGFAKRIAPLLLLGVLMAGALLGRPGHEGLIPSVWVARLVGGDSPGANLFASVAGAFMYFATLTEVPILRGLIGNGMGRGPALALLLAGPALSLPAMLVIRGVMGTKKTLTFVALVVVVAALTGILFGAIF